MGCTKMEETLRPRSNLEIVLAALLGYAKSRGCGGSGCNREVDNLGQTMPMTRDKKGRIQDVGAKNCDQSDQNKAINAFVLFEEGVI